jgi:hypothetical protein
MKGAHKGAKTQRKEATRGGINLTIGSTALVTGYLCAFALLRDNVIVFPQWFR